MTLNLLEGPQFCCQSYPACSLYIYRVAPISNKVLVSPSACLWARHWLGARTRVEHSQPTPAALGKS